jgi:hypothetical protein
MAGFMADERRIRAKRIRQPERTWGGAMLAADQIDRAIVAHAFWRQRLFFALATGKCELTPEVARSDRRCAFGEWLHDLPQDARETVRWKRVAALHAAFHELAGEALTAAVAGRAEEARRLLALGGEFSQASASLIAALSNWRTVEEAAPATDDAVNPVDIVRFPPPR